ncbi:response regulator [Paenibacillus qinlingensis]|uniref:Two-component system response regulator YesN n=1 Tax=Paenibacillus qinlingensis TaxID=1837343 RepID=A0ABU1NS52_9BACL|nr:response regulator [Paenibacillus qinlingensis]MDR6550308.1 two-component system response regulator YesN [Paenibacillus qinlingensis]
MIRVLIVDDDKLARKGLISIMPWSEHGMTVAGEAANGAKALEFLDQHTVDLMFVDISMPVMSGIELIQAARIKYPTLRSVMLTFHEDFETVQSAYRLGVLDYISKVRLELEDDQQILKRIRLKLADEFPQHISVTGATTTLSIQHDSVEDEQWRKLEHDWHSLYWLYNEAIFQHLCTQTIAMNRSVRRLEALFMRVISQVEIAAKLDTGFWSEIDDIRSAVEWIRRYRMLIYTQVTKSTDLSKTMICMLKAVQFIREHTADTLHAENVAEHVNMSRSYFCQCFKKLTGTTFNDYLRQERIRAAERLLSETNRPVTWIAHAVGYGDAKYFSQIFYEQTRLLPTEFRAQRHREI